MARHVFLCYSREDGGEVALRLRDLLRAQECEVWLDTERIGGGASWSREIEKALSECDVLIAVLTHGAFVSEICRAEQIWALDEGKVVIPVLAADGAVAPVHLRGRQWRKFPEQAAELVADLAGEGVGGAVEQRPLRYNTVPNLPLNYVIRERALAELRALVFTEGAGANIAVTAVAGMGGIGKTVLATALCRDPAVRRAFPEGIAWITIGREWDGDFVTRMREVGRALGDDLSGYDNPWACENRYRTMLCKRAALVVLDDVWNLAHLQALLVDAPRSRFLFTTRDAGIAKAVTDRKYSADLLSAGEALELLAQRAGIAVERLPPEAEQIIAACGRLAAAVAQVGGILRDLSLEEWRDTLDALQSADISGIEDRLPAGQGSFFKSLAISVDALSQQMLGRYLKLAVLLEDVPAPLAVLQTLWKVKDAEGRRTARYFVDRSLAAWEDAARPARGIRLHDLQLDYVRARCEDRGALQLIHEALQLSANVVAQRPQEFAAQMIGRLLALNRAGTIAEFIEDVAEGAPRPWLRPLWPSLHPPGTGLLRSLAGHSDGLSAVAVTPDGRRAVSAAYDETLKVWDLESGRELHTLRGHSNWVTGVAVTMDGKRVVSASFDKTLRIWDLNTGRHVRTMTGHLGIVYGIAVTVDGACAVSASDDTTLKVWDLESGREVRTLAGHSDWVCGVAVSADGRRVVSASFDRTVRIWDLKSGQELWTLVGHADCVRGVAVTPDGRYAISASDDNTLKMWELESGREVRTLTGHSDVVYGVAVTANGRRAISASADSTLKVWDLRTGREDRTLPGHADTVIGVAVAADGRRAVSASFDRTVKLWDLETSQALTMPAGHSDWIRAVAVTVDGRFAVSASDDKTLKVWDLDSRQELHTLRGHSDWVRGVGVGADGRRAVSASFDRTLKVWDLRSGRELYTLDGHSASVLGVAVTADGGRAVSASEDATLKVWDLANGLELLTLSGHAGAVNGVATTNGLAISASSDKTLKVWDTHSGEELRTLVGHSKCVRAVAVSGDGGLAVSASDDCTLKVWDVKSGRELRTLEGHSASVRGVAVTPDGCGAVSASLDNTFRLWDLESGALISVFSCDGAARCCAWAGADHILAGDSAGRLHMLELVR